MTDTRKEIEATLRRVEEILQTAEHGYEDMVRHDRSRRFTGLRNLIAFGRSVTLVLQNLRSAVGKREFDDWYLPKQEEMKRDPLLRYFVEARNNILKQGKLNVSISATITFSPGDLRKFGPPPPGTTGFFIGDRNGGSGWEVELPDGTKEKYYVVLPTSMGEVKQQFADLPEAIDPDLKDKSVEELCRLYLDRLGLLVDEARKHFLGEEEVQRVKGKRLPPYLRVIK